MLAKKKVSHACTHVLLHQHWCTLNEKQVENALLTTKPPSVQVTVTTHLSYLKPTYVWRERAS